MSWPFIVKETIKKSYGVISFCNSKANSLFSLMCCGNKHGLQLHKYSMIRSCNLPSDTPYGSVKEKYNNNNNRQLDASRQKYKEKQEK